ncbi:hypothetical protein RAC69_16380, partial [Microbacterium sp. LS_15]|uniref:hypothetical protein n=1 Tax=Microbacterium sp. LS_15 TaxID=3055790 RepID=UPI0035C05D46
IHVRRRRQRQMGKRDRPRTDPPASLGEARAAYVPPVAKRDDGVTDYFATSLPELLLFTQEGEDES